MSKESVKQFLFLPKYKKACFILMIIGMIGVAAGFAFDPQRALSNLWLDAVYFLTLSVGGLFLVALQFTAGARWSEVLRKVPEAISAYIPIGGLVLLCVGFGLHSLFHWSHHDVVENDPILAGKAAYLNITFFFIRLIVAIGLWTLFSKLIRSNSQKLDQTGDLKYYRRNIVLSPVFMIVFGITISMTSFDWLMSVDPHWYSTIFAVYNFSGLFVNAFAVITIMVYLLKERGLLNEVNDNHYHDLGKYVFAFSTFWAYIWFSQFMLIWYGNIPEETIYFVHRLDHGWNWLFFLNVVINFLVPFFILMPRGTKRNGSILMRVCVVLLIGRWLDLYLMIMPSVTKQKSSIGLIEVSIALGFAGLFVYVVANALSKGRMVPVKTVILDESLELHQ